MFKKLITIGILIIIIALSMPVSYAQRAIDPALKPQNAPTVPLAGPARSECLKKQSETEKLADKEVKNLTKEEKEKIAKYWDENSQMCRGHEEEPITAFIQIIAGALLMIAGGVAVIVIAIGGIMYATAGGRQNQMEFAKNTLLYGVIGMIVMIFAYFIVQFVISIIVGA
jgi:hypothetical protein